MKKLLYILIFPLYFIDVVGTLVANILEVIVNSAQSIILASEKYINAQKPDKPKAGS